ncbi:MAG: hypothetical protein COA80_01750 [Leeuwenhoekiella sp.]|uniref:Uncharacterized protein n=1 Tax=Leeuwenhoekiella nanhaiensis TaxID=1655491 RepID=A0A2G1VP67_9FLAO|nr:hypothetical protein [Leeuwenhoekiella nanhaiensis]PHQ28552.1 hypothetical protein CJ305_14780 [Leeuwenhoekiella nanhaiensis]PHS02092.1 MAG: hypothetical protein COA80_01750 [Leeuwenhoekiella sp.]
MKYIIIILFLFATNSLPTYIQADKTFYYKCDYKKGNYYTILSSGTQNEIDEVYGIDKNYYTELPEFDLNKIDVNKIIDNSKKHLKTRFNALDLKLTEIKYERINEKDLDNPKNWFILLTFVYNDKGHVQMVPVLPNNRIILSNKE